MVRDEGSRGGEAGGGEASSVGGGTESRPESTAGDEGLDNPSLASRPYSAGDITSRMNVSESTGRAEGGSDAGEGKGEGSGENASGKGDSVPDGSVSIIGLDATTSTTCLFDLDVSIVDTSVLDSVSIFETLVRIQGLLPSPEILLLSL